MSFTAAEVFQRTETILQDAGAVRWPYPEQLLWLNDAGREVVTLKPNANAKTVELALVAGTKQALPAQYHALLEVKRNLTGAEGARVGGRAITTAMRSVMDNLMPNWHDPTFLPYAAMVRHVVDDPLDQATFYVVPGNTGAGVIEAVVSALPTPLAVPSVDSDILAAYAALTVDLPRIYLNPVVDYVLYRSFSKDMAQPGAAQRAGAHYSAFNGALGVKAQAEVNQNVNQRAG